MSIHNIVICKVQAAVENAFAAPGGCNTVPYKSIILNGMVYIFHSPLNCVLTVVFLPAPVALPSDRADSAPSCTLCVELHVHKQVIHTFCLT